MCCFLNTLHLTPAPTTSRDCKSKSGCFRSSMLHPEPHVGIGYFGMGDFAPLLLVHGYLLVDVPRISLLHFPRPEEVDVDRFPLKVVDFSQSINMVWPRSIPQEVCPL